MEGQGQRGLRLPSEEGVSSLLTEAWAQEGLASEWHSGCGVLVGHRARAGQWIGKGYGMRDQGLDEGVKPLQQAQEAGWSQARKGRRVWLGGSLGSLRSVGLSNRCKLRGDGEAL